MAISIYFITIKTNLKKEILPFFAFYAAYDTMYPPRLGSESVLAWNVFYWHLVKVAFWTKEGQCSRKKSVCHWFLWENRIFWPQNRSNFENVIQPDRRFICRPGFLSFLSKLFPKFCFLKFRLFRLFRADFTPYLNSSFVRWFK